MTPLKKNRTETEVRALRQRRSHELRLLHRLLVRAGVPRRVAGDVRSGRAHRRLDAARRAPHGRHRGGAARQSAAGGQSAGVDGAAAALFHQLLEFGAFVLEPDLHLQGDSVKKTNTFMASLYIIILILIIINLKINAINKLIIMIILMKGYF